MNTNDLKALFLRDLDRLKTELESYTKEEFLWLKADGINNSAGNLILHLCGNLQHFIGAILGKTGYVRQRDFEFSGRVSYKELLALIDETKKMLEVCLSKMDTQEVESNYPLEPFGYPMTVKYFLMHLYGHFNYHLGQINYHRRILS